MGDKQIIINIIERAIKNGYKPGWYPHYDDITFTGYWLEQFLESDESIYPLIFSHDFAKAVFGEIGEEHNTNRLCGYAALVRVEEHDPVKEKKDWKFHITQMVLSEKPLQYLEEYL